MRHLILLVSFNLAGPLFFSPGVGAFSSQINSLSSSSFRGRSADSSTLPLPACNGATDDTATLQALINASVGGNLVIGGLGPCLISRTLNVPTNSHLTIAGTILLAPNANTSMLNMQNAYNVVIDGGGVIDGNWLSQNFGVRHDFTVARASGLWAAAILSSARRTPGLTIQHVANWPVNLVTVAGGANVKT